MDFGTIYVNYLWTGDKNKGYWFGYHVTQRLLCHAKKKVCEAIVTNLPLHCHDSSTNLLWLLHNCTSACVLKVQCVRFHPF